MRRPTARSQINNTVFSWLTYSVAYIFPMIGIGGAQAVVASQVDCWLGMTAAVTVGGDEAPPLGEGGTHASENLVASARQSPPGLQSPEGEATYSPVACSSSAAGTAGATGATSATGSRWPYSYERLAAWVVLGGPKGEATYSPVAAMVQTAATAAHRFSA